MRCACAAEEAPQAFETLLAVRRDQSLPHELTRSRPYTSRQDPEFVVFRDRSPGSKVHLLAVPKRHVGAPCVAILLAFSEGGSR